MSARASLIRETYRTGYCTYDHHGLCQGDYRARGGEKCTCKCHARCSECGQSRPSKEPSVDGS